MDSIFHSTDLAEYPLITSWVLSHGELFEDFLGEWYVPTTYFWQLFESNRNASWAEELAWYVANLPTQSDCEAYAPCMLNVHVERRFLQYWTRFPNGPHIGEALTGGEESVRAAAEVDCDKDEEPKILANIRASLSEVTHPAKEKILTSLSDIERKCAK